MATPPTEEGKRLIAMPDCSPDAAPGAMEAMLRFVHDPDAPLPEALHRRLDILQPLEYLGGARDWPPRGRLLASLAADLPPVLRGRGGFFGEFLDLLYRVPPTAAADWPHAEDPAYPQPRYPGVSPLVVTIMEHIGPEYREPVELLDAMFHVWRSVDRETAFLAAAAAPKPPANHVMQWLRHTEEDLDAAAALATRMVPPVLVAVSLARRHELTTERYARLRGGLAYPDFAALAAYTPLVAQHDGERLRAALLADADLSHHHPGEHYWASSYLLRLRPGHDYRVVADNPNFDSLHVGVEEDRWTAGECGGECGGQLVSAYMRPAFAKPNQMFVMHAESPLTLSSCAMSHPSKPHYLRVHKRNPSPAEQPGSPLLPDQYYVLVVSLDAAQYHPGSPYYSPTLLPDWVDNAVESD